MAADRVTQYAKMVTNGEITAGKTQYLACKRHLEDLARQGSEQFPYLWNEKKANTIIAFAESLTLAEGEEARPLKLHDFQAFIFGSWNGWVTMDGYRRFRTSYVQVARQNGKSIGNAIPSLYYGNFDGYNYPQVFCVATKEMQARIVLRECIKFINADEELRGGEYEKGLFTIKEYKSLIVCNNTKGEIKALGRDTETIDGFRPYFGSVDEYHKHKTNQMYKLLTDGTRTLKQCLISVITTAGFDLNSPCYKLYDYCKKVVEGSVKDETQFVFISELDKDDDPFDEKIWIKANPLWTDEMYNSLKSDVAKAKAMGGEEELNFLTKSLNKWVQVAHRGYINFESWQKCATTKTIADFKGYSCFVGLDLSAGGDLTSLALVFPFFANEVKKYYIYSHSFIPSKRIDEHAKTVIKTLLNNIKSLIKF